MAATYSEIKYALDQISTRNQKNLNAIVKAAGLYAGASEDLDKMPGEFSAVITDIDAKATANPTVAAYTDAKSEKDLLVSDFQALKTRVLALVAAISGI